jgi:hypothetical protein
VSTGIRHTIDTRFQMSGVASGVASLCCTAVLIPLVFRASDPNHLQTYTPSAIEALRLWNRSTWTGDSRADIRLCPTVSHPGAGNIKTLSPGLGYVMHLLCAYVRRLVVKQYTSSAALIARRKTFVSCLRSLERGSSTTLEGALQQ